MRQNKYEYDAFISHAVEDKIPIANELCAKLERAGLKIWYSGKELGIGDSIEKTIQKGLTRSRYGIVIFSPTYLAKNWTIREFYTLLAKEIGEHKVILPVLYNITLDDLKNKDMVMADRFAVNANKGIDFVVERLVHEVKISYAEKPQHTWLAKLWFLLILSLLTNLTFIFKGMLFPVEGKKSVLKVESLDLKERNQQLNVFNQAQFLEAVNGLFSQINAARCNHNSGEGAHPLVYRTALRPIQDGSVHGNSGYYGGENNEARSNDRPSSGTKMTMAVVFQMENLAEEPPELNQEMDQAESMVSLNAPNDLYKAVTNAAITGHTTEVHCSHAAGLND